MMILKLFLGVAMAAVIVSGFLTPAPQGQIGEASRIFYFHVPQAWICVLAFATSMVFSIRYLRSKSLLDDQMAVVAARLGFIACILATVTGAVFAKVTWGAFWNWDPRQTSIFVLLLIYAAYFALRNAVEEEQRKAALSAVYAIFAFVTVPYLIFVIPRLLPSLHPSDTIVGDGMEFHLSKKVSMIFASSMVLFTALYYWLFDLARRTARVDGRQREDEL